MRPLTKLSTWILSSLLVLLGFGGCKSSKKAITDENEAPKEPVTNIHGRPIPPRPDDPTRMRVLYGPPPAQYRNTQQSK